MLKYVKNPKGISFKVYVQPKASKNEIKGMHGDALKIRLTAPPVDGAANKMCLKYLAKCLSVPQSRLEILSGHSSRSKHVLFKNENDKDTGSDFNNLKHKIEALLTLK
jgi:uncharacterized protein (TIGR00251 family)